jgi:fatty-acyl-CoA synthase
MQGVAMSNPGKPSTLADVVRAQATLRPTSVAFIFEGRETSFAAVDLHANRVANGLRNFGVRPQQRIAYLGKNSDSYLELLLGAIKADVIMVPINWRLAASEVAYVIADCEARILFVGREFAEHIRDIRAELPDVRVVVTTEGEMPGWPDYTTWRDSQRSDDPNLAICEDSVTVQLYTSGTTGQPKGAMLSHANFLAMFDALKWTGAGESGWNRWSSDDVWLAAMPLSHIAGMKITLLAFFNGARSVILREFDPVAALDSFERFAVNRLFLVPAAMQLIVRLPRARDADFSRLHYVLYGGSPISAALLAECIAVLGCGFAQVYGMTETTGIVTILPPEDHVAGSDRLRAAGHAIPGVELAVLGPDGMRLPPGEVGEIAARTRTNMAGYWKQPEATARTLDRHNWLRTGDAGYLDKDGYLYIRDRVKDMIISGGENVYPAEVESAICDHPDVADAAVIGVPDDKWGEAVKAVVVMRPSRTATASDIISFTRDRIASFKAPKSVDFADALPRNASGKILHRNLRDPYWAGRERQVN